MTQYTWNRGLGVPGPYNDSDFATDPSGPAAGQWTWNRGLGFPGPWNDSDFTTSPGTPGGDIVAKSSTLTAVVVGSILDVTDVLAIADYYGGVAGLIGEPTFSVTVEDVDDIALTLTETGQIDLEWV